MMKTNALLNGLSTAPLHCGGICGDSTLFKFSAVNRSYTSSTASGEGRTYRCDTLTVL